MLILEQIEVLSTNSVKSFFELLKSPKKSFCSAIGLVICASEAYGSRRELKRVFRLEIPFSAWGVCDKLDKAKEFFVEMEQNGCFPDGCTYYAIIRGFLARKKYFEALVLLKEMVANGFSADASTVSWIVNLRSTGQHPALLEMIKWFMTKD
ncbi:hypothetical protein C3L33_12691, partial [Rhododendron williamsianum]